MAGIVTQQPGVADLTMASTDSMGGEVYSRRSNVRAPEPNPNFSFPRLSQNPTELSSSSEHSRKRIRPQNLSLLPKPQEDNLVISQTIEPTAETSPGKSRPMSARSTGHRRGGSEFIGGDGNASGPGLMSSSPTKGVANLPTPPSSTGRRRGHAHRRSGAMSTTDFSAMFNSNPSIPPVPGSAPATPSGHAHNIPPVPTHHLERHHSQPIMMTTREKIEEANAAGEKEDMELAATPRNAASRPRVGFSERVEFIPRPLSTISAETASTISTIKASHSVNGSISSMLDQRPPTPVSTTHPADSSDDSRPTTSDTASQPEIFGPPEQIDETSDRPTSASGKALFFKRRRSPPPQPWQEDNISPGTSVEPRFFEKSLSSASPSSPSSPSLAPPSTAGSNGSFSTDPKHEKRKSRMRSILSRKSRKHSKEEMPAASPPIASEPEITNAPAGLISLDDVNFDEDTSLVIHSAGYEEPKPAPFQPSPLKDSFERDDNAVLDLDATYNSISITDDSSQSLTNFMKDALPSRQHRRTESAPSLSPVQRQGFGPGKASPQMADVFEEEEEEETSPRAQRPKARSFIQPKASRLQGLGVQIVDSGSSGESVQPRRKSRSPSSKTTNSGSKTPSAGGPGSLDNDVAMSDVAVSSSSLNEEPRFSMVTKSSDEETITPTGLEAPPKSLPPLSSSNLTNDTSTAPHPLDFALPPSLNPHAHHDSSDFSTSSAAPSPNPTTVSFDAPRLNTAASSITDRTTWSASQSQQVSSANTSACRGDESAASEDVPSLTSSASTGFSGHPSHPSISTNASSASPSPVVSRGPGASIFGSGQGYHAHTVSGMSRPRTSFIPGDSNARPSSVGGEQRAFSIAGLGGLSPRASMPRSWGSRPSTSNGSKRSSLASLSRLMSKGNESERSKLSISWGASEGDGSESGGVMGATEGRDKSGKRKLSRMLKFWKGREKERERPATPTLNKGQGGDVEMTVD